MVTRFCARMHACLSRVAFRFSVPLVMVIIVATGGSIAQAQAKIDDLPKPVTKSLPAGGELSIFLTYWKSKQGIEAPVVVFVGGEKNNRLDWPEALCLRLQREGYAVITVDLRFQGQSLPAGAVAGGAPAKLKAVDYANMVAVDMELVKEFIYEEHMAQNLNMNKMAIVGADIGADVAMTFAMRDWLKKPYNDAPTIAAATPKGQDVKALVLISPQSAAGLRTLEAIKVLRNPLFDMAVLQIVGRKDKSDKGLSKKYFEQFSIPEKENKDRMFFDEYETAAHGTEMLGKGLKKGDSVLEDRLVAFLNLRVKQKGNTWLDRRPRDKRTPAPSTN